MHRLWLHLLVLWSSVLSLRAVRYTIGEDKMDLEMISLDSEQKELIFLETQSEQLESQTPTSTKDAKPSKEKRHYTVPKVPVGSFHAVRDTSSSKPVNVAVCIVGGMRRFVKHAESLRQFLFLNHSSQVSISAHVLTWDDADLKLDLSGSNSSTIQQLIREAYKDIHLENISLWSNKEVSETFMSEVSKLSPSLFKTYPHCHGGNGVRGCLAPWATSYNQAFLWERCSTMHQDADVVVKTRPDFCFKRGKQLRFQGRDNLTNAPFFAIGNDQYLLNDTSVFVLGRPSGVLDDPLFVASRHAFDHSIASLRKAMTTGEHQVFDDQRAEDIIKHHLKFKGADAVILGSREELGQVDHYVKEHNQECGKDF